jgi:ABC-type glycerol-3-phosphate transport system permease component
MTGTGRRPALRLDLLAGHGVLLLLSLLALFPLFWMFVTSLKPANAIFDGALLPLAPTLEHYAYVWRAIPIGRMLLNTFQMALLQTGAQLLTSLLAGYAFGRWSFRGDRLLLLLFVSTWLVPFQATMIPNYVLLARMGLLNTVWAVVLPQVTAAFSVLLLRQYVKGFPRELLDAARVDGAGSWRTLWAVVVPNLRAPLAALGILLFISGWNEYFWPLLVINRLEASVVQVGLQMFLTAEGDQWGPLMAAAAIASLPVLVVYVLLQRQVIAAFVRSGLR